MDIEYGNKSYFYYIVTDQLFGDKGVSVLADYNGSKFKQRNKMVNYGVLIAIQT
ncbi:hypothetical protein C7475_1011129 [Chitinophaga sp. S165]|nr:hypothetical protein C7475_1011129 [Chitinophaga sp. S165]